jgi:hypothetical protein
MPRLSNIAKQFFDNNGDPLAGGKLFFYETGTSTLAATYSNAAQTTANTNPVILDASGRMGDVFYEGGLKIILTDASDVTIETRDPVYATGGGFDSWRYVEGPQDAAFTAVAGSYYFVSDGAAGDYTITLPASPALGDRVGFNYTTTPATGGDTITVNNNAATQVGTVGNIDSSNVVTFVEFVYSGSAWVINNYRSVGVS